MEVNEIIRLSFRNLIRRKLRSGLTVIGIIIGITSIISLISLSQGLEESITGEFARLGSNNIIISQKGLAGPPIGTKALTEKDLEFVRRFNEFEFVLPGYIKSAEVEFNNQKIITLVSATGQDLADERAEIFGFELEDGKNLGDTSRRDVVIGNTLAKETFGKEMF